MLLLFVASYLPRRRIKVGGGEGGGVCHNVLLALGERNGSCWRRCVLSFSRFLKPAFCSDQKDTQSYYVRWKISQQQHKLHDDDEKSATDGHHTEAEVRPEICLPSGEQTEQFHELLL